MPGATARQQKVTLNNVEVRYASIALQRSCGSRINDVAVKYPYVTTGGCYYLYCVSDTILTKCEACSATNGTTTGDGINVDTPLTEGRRDAVCLSAKLVDCWAHDNNDDGYSDHDRSECIVEGGLYEYNGKGGITPSYGANDVIRDTICRYNRGAGILCAGNPESDNGRLYTNVHAMGCVCYGQVNGFYALDSETIINAVNCVTYGNNVGYKTGSGNIYAVNCKSDDTSAKVGNVTVQAVSDLT